jgi:hypothetical protein
VGSQLTPARGELCFCAERNFEMRDLGGDHAGAARLCHYGTRFALRSLAPWPHCLSGWESGKHWRAQRDLIQGAVCRLRVGAPLFGRFRYEPAAFTSAVLAVQQPRHRLREGSAGFIGFAPTEPRAAAASRHLLTPLRPPDAGRPTETSLHSLVPFVGQKQVSRLLSEARVARSYQDGFEKINCLA